MKTLVEKSIEIHGMGHSEVKTVFHLNTIPVLTEEATEEQKKQVKEMEFENLKISKDMRFTSLTKISGRKLSVWFKYSEDGKEVQDKLQMTIVKSDDEQVIKDFILSQINAYLA
jgi:hypothetical protein